MACQVSTDFEVFCDTDAMVGEASLTRRGVGVACRSVVLEGFDEEFHVAFPVITLPNLIVASR